VMTPISLTVLYMHLFWFFGQTNVGRHGARAHRSVSSMAKAAANTGTLSTTRMAVHTSSGRCTR